MTFDVVSLDPQALLQMVGTLPAGQVVDQVVCDAVTNGVPSVGCIPFRNSLSPRGVGRVLFTHSMEGARLLPSVLSGLRDEDSVRRVAAWADEPWSRWAVLLNPVSERLHRRDLPRTPSPRSIDDNDPLRLTGRTFLSTLPGWRRVRGQKPGRFWRSYVKWLPHHFEKWGSAWDWAYLPGARDGLLELLRERMHFPLWEESDRSNVTQCRQRIDQVFEHSREDLPDDGVAVGSILSALAAVNDPDHWPYVTRLLTELRDVFTQGPVTFLSDVQLASAGGAAYLNAWLPGVLWSDTTAWRLVLARGGKPVAGRLVGEELFKVTGDDLGLWSTAVSLLDDWDDSLPNWLAAVAALK